MSEAVVDLVNALKERLKDSPLVDFITEDAVTENQSIIGKYDSDGDGGLLREQLGSAVEKDLTEKQKSLSPEGLRAELEILHSVADGDRDGSFTLDELTDFLIKAAEELNELHDKRFRINPMNNLLLT
ncbi:MAG: hypothetical protein F4Z66_06480 [Gammaproteobacteria bacterium]|nr:hypothetical protein [Gammaproteobacteria bacterium]